jgi:SOS-response transcriptional repressor LexA
MTISIAHVVGQLLPQFDGKQSELAKVLETTQPTVSRWLSGSEPEGPMRDRILALAEARGVLPSREQRRPKSASYNRFAIVPIVSWVSAGALANTAGMSQVDQIGEIAVADLGEGEFFALKVSGNSMDRISPESSIIIINRTQRMLQPGKPYVFAYKGETTYKLWRDKPPRLAPFSTDPANEPHFIEKRQGLYVLGRVRRSIINL